MDDQPADPIPGETEEFGFRRVALGTKKPLVRSVFDSVAPRYDLMNDLMSGGIHRLWKRELIGRLAPRRGEHVLDVAGGTGDVALRLVGRAGAVTVCDINARMLEVGRDRALDRGLIDEIAWICGDAEALPVGRAAVDGYTIAFGLRNVSDIGASLAEARRVLRPGGRFLCLEFSHVALPVIRRLYDLYSFEILPRLGRWVARDEASYRYLAESIRRFPPQEELAEMIRGAGFTQVRYANLSSGIAAIHSGWRL